ncbi:MAG: hypothetical protein ACJ75L_00805 [Gaiellaceae bacterium]
MVRRWRLTAQVALVGVLAVLAFPADGSALRAVYIALTPNGPSPSVLTLPAGLYPVWLNQDTVAHTVVFADGRCSFQVAPGGYGQCTGGFSQFAGQFAYTVDGSTQARIDVVPEGRAVTLTARTHRIAPGATLRLHGELDVPILSPPGPPAPQPVVVLARHDRHHPFHRIRVVRATTHGWHLNWQLGVRPRARTIYIVEANSQPAGGGQYWQRAWSRPFTVVPARR